MRPRFWLLGNLQGGVKDALRLDRPASPLSRWPRGTTGSWTGLEVFRLVAGWFEASGRSRPLFFLVAWDSLVAKYCI